MVTTRYYIDHERIGFRLTIQTKIEEKKVGIDEWEKRS